MYAQTVIPVSMSLEVVTKVAEQRRIASRRNRSDEEGLGSAQSASVSRESSFEFAE